MFIQHVCVCVLRRRGGRRGGTIADPGVQGVCSGHCDVRGSRTGAVERDAGVGFSLRGSTGDEWNDHGGSS